MFDLAIAPFWTTRLKISGIHAPLEKHPL